MDPGKEKATIVLKGYSTVRIVLKKEVVSGAPGTQPLYDCELLNRRQTSVKPVRFPQKPTLSPIGPAVPPNRPANRA